MESIAESRFDSDTGENHRATGRLFSGTVNSAAPEEDPTTAVLFGEKLRQDAEVILISMITVSLQLGRRNNSSKASLDNGVETSANSSQSEYMCLSDAPDEIDLPQKNDKRFHVFMEMLETEENYLRMLKLIKSVYRDPIEERLKGDKSDPILSRGEIQRIFDKVGPLIPVHENILEQLRCAIKNWNTQQLVGLVWAHGANDMVKPYSQYVNAYNEALQTLRECDDSRPKFHSFLKKRTDEHHPDFKAITQGIQMVENVLKETNESRRQTETYERFMTVCNEVENFPSELISSSREFICQADFMLLKVDAAGSLSDNKNNLITSLLFNDVVVIAKIRDATNSNTSTNSQGGTLKRQMPLRRLGPLGFGSGKQKKKYKYIETLRFNCIRELFFIRDHGVFFIKVRNPSADFLCGFQVSPDMTVDAAIDFFQAVHQKVASTYFRRNVVLEEMTTQTIAKTNLLTVEDRSIVERTLKSAKQLSPSGTIRRPSRRRAVQRLLQPQARPREVHFKDGSLEHQ